MTHLVEERHGVAGVYGKYQGQEGEETGLEGSHRVLHTTLIHVTVKVKALAMNLSQPADHHFHKGQHHLSSTLAHSH